MTTNDTEAGKPAQAAEPLNLRLNDGLVRVRHALDGLVFAAHQVGEDGKSLCDSADVQEWIAYVMREASAARDAAFSLCPILGSVPVELAITQCERVSDAECQCTALKPRSGS